MSDIKVNLKLDGSDFSATTRQAQDAVDDLSDKLKKIKGPLGDASGGISSFGSRLGDAAKGIAAVTAGLAAAATAIAGYGLVKAIEAATEAEQAFNAVANSLRLSGELSQAALDDVEKFAAELQDLTGLGDDTTYSMLAMAQSFGLTKDEAKKVVAAANDMSVATGKDLKTSVEALSKSFNGSTKELVKLNPEVKTLTKEQLAAGKAVELLSDQFGGSAANRLKTFGGSLAALTGRVGDFIEEVGGVVTKSPAAIDILRFLERGVKDVTEAFAGNADDIRKWVRDTAADFISSLARMANGLVILNDVFKGFSAGKPFSVFETITDVVVGLIDKFLLLARGFTEIKLLFAAPIDTVLADSLAELKSSRTDLAPLINQLELIDQRREALSKPVSVDTFGNSGLAAATAKLEVFAEKLRGLPDTREIEVAIKVPKEPIQRVADTFSKEMTKSLEAAFLAAGIIPSAKGAQKEFDAFNPKPGDKPTPPPKDKSTKEIAKEQGAAVASSIVANIDKGAQGVLNVFSSIADKIPVFGGLISGAIQFLGQGPENVKRMNEEFTNAIPEVIKNIGTAIPALLESAFKQGPVLAESIADAMPEIIQAFIVGIPRIIVALAKSIPGVFAGVGKSLIRSITEGAMYNKEKQKEAVQQFKDGVGQAARNVVSGLQQIGPFLVQAMQKAGDAFSQFIFTLPEKLGEAFQATFDFLAQGLSDIWVAFRDLFTEGLPGIWTALTEGIGPFIDNFGVKLNEVFTEAISEIGRVFGEGLSEAANGVGEMVTGAFGGLPEALSDVWVTVRDGFVNALQDIPQAFADALRDAVSGALGGGGGDNNPLKKLGGGIKLATGGYVTGQGNRDSVPATLAPGELVIDRTTGPRLNQFLDEYSKQPDQSSGPGDSTTMALLAKIVDLLQRPTTIETTAKVDGKGLADIILKLNRTNQRLA